MTFLAVAYIPCRLFGGLPLFGLSSQVAQAAPLPFGRREPVVNDYLHLALEPWYV
jgi:hypothetical protein